MTNRVLALAAVVMAVSGTAAAEPVKEVRKTLPLDPGGRVTVDTYKGTVRIDPWDRNEVEVHARVVPDSALFDSSDLVESTEIRIDGSSGSVWVKSDYSRARGRGWGVLGFFFSSQSNLPDVHYRIRIPKRANLRVKDYRSEAWVGPLTGDLEFESYRGRLTASGLDGTLQFKSYRGEADLRVAKFASRSRLETYRGGIRLTLPPSTGFRIETDLGRHADLNSDFALPVVKRDRHRTDYRGAVNGGGPLLVLKSYRGEIRLRRGL